jgi:hypothetical protein
MSAAFSCFMRQPRGRTTIPVFRVAVQGSEAVVTASDTDYVMTYHKPANSPQLLARSFPRKEYRRVLMSLADFLTAACKLANDKASQLSREAYPTSTRTLQPTFNIWRYLNQLGKKGATSSHAEGG